MKINDKVLVAFLVSMGLFSSVQARQYVSALSAGEKAVLMQAQNSGADVGPVESNAISGGSAGNDKI
ncbi:MAG TPA: hypothetical protein DEQ38_07170 [Elusimicrobia bacterium]|nr:MAG: hypothetical protein A2089_08030 [Elusimicrobia bacterium GWD2_63_28]HCC47880.1 hypothetical protein [Elusimicrobiota bacterium]